MMVDDRYTRTVRIPVRIEDGTAVSFDGKPLSWVRNGAMGELVLNVDQLRDPVILEALQPEDTVEILGEGTTVLLGLNGSIPLGKGDGLMPSRRMHIPSSYCFAKVVLQEALRLKIRGWKHARLLSCRCYIPLLEEEAGSLNHALTLLSEKYETKRTAHTGNVFKQGFVELEGVWWSLHHIRAPYEGIDFEAIRHWQDSGGMSPAAGREG